MCGGGCQGQSIILFLWLGGVCVSGCGKTCHRLLHQLYRGAVCDCDAEETYRAGLGRDIGEVGEKSKNHWTFI